MRDGVAFCLISSFKVGVLLSPCHRCCSRFCTLHLVVRMGRSSMERNEVTRAGGTSITTIGNLSSFTMDEICYDDLNLSNSMRKSNLSTYQGEVSQEHSLTRTTLVTRNEILMITLCTNTYTGNTIWMQLLRAGFENILSVRWIAMKPSFLI